jgi:AsmA-like C-terminal region
MPLAETQTARRHGWRMKRWHWIAGIAVVFLIVAIATSIVISRAEPILRARVIETLSTRFKSRVELDAFHVSVLRGLLVSGSGLRIFGPADPNNHEPGMQPVISVGEFRFRTGITDLFRSPTHVDTVYLKGLQLNLPPKEQRAQMEMAPKAGKIKIVVDKFMSDGAQLIINTLKPGKLPLEFNIASLKMTSIGPDAPLHFDADLTNPKPVGNIVSSGSFGPWQAENPRQTPVSGTYSFRDADLGTIKGIGGILSSTGKYTGTLENIVVDGATDTPDFRIAISGRSVPLHTDFHAIVDGTSGDTYLQPVNGKILDTSLVAKGSVVRTDNPKGHHVELDVTIDKGRIDDLLKLAVRTNPPVMTGYVRLKTKLDLPPGEPDVSNRLKLAGSFEVSQVHFTNDKTQGKIDALSMRSQGKPKLAQDQVPDNILSNLRGTFGLAGGLLSFSQLVFQVPGTRVNLTGKYSLDGNEFDFHGKARLQANLSHMVTGWKSILLKPVDPFFSKNGAGTELPVKITGTKSEPHFGTDFGHKEEEEQGRKEKKVE